MPYVPVGIKETKKKKIIIIATIGIWSNIMTIISNLIIINIVIIFIVVITLS